MMEPIEALYTVAATINISSSIGSIIIVSNGNQSINLKDEFIYVAFFFYYIYKRVDSIYETPIFTQEANKGEKCAPLNTQY